ncbi:MAG TPA: AFG1/ZapE family ATPase [Arthrobacter sp.]|jgi:cell division protein ZapE
MGNGNDGAAKPAFSRGRIITPGTEHQLGRYGLFPPSPAQQRAIRTSTLKLTAKSAEPELLWITFAELCGSQVPAADYEDLAGRYGTWVIDGVPAPAADPSPQKSPAWHRFSTVVDILYARDVTLFLLGTGLSMDLAHIASRLSLLELVESADVPVVDPAAGS